MSLDKIDPPSTRAEIVARLRELHAASVAACAVLSTPEFVAPRGTSWSPADHLRHLTKTMRAITRGLNLSWWKLRIAFGKARKPSRSYDGVRESYLNHLPAFTGRSNPFAPSSRNLEEDPEAWRAQVMRYYDVAFDELVRAAERWDEAALDKYRLPHPLIGKLTLREMLFFTLYHNWHHIRRVNQ